MELTIDESGAITIRPQNGADEFLVTGLVKCIVKGGRVMMSPKGSPPLVWEAHGSARLDAGDENIAKLYLNSFE